jgi:hypothetical protein
MSLMRYHRNEAAPLLRRAEVVGLAAGAVGLVACVVAFFGDREHFFRAYLWSWLLCLGASLGATALVMLHHLTGGAWGWLVRRPAEGAGFTVPLLAVLFVPLALGLKYLYPWARPEEVAAHAILRHRLTLFTPASVLVRSFLFLLVWSFWAWRLRSLSIRHDRSGDPALLVSLRRYSAIGFLVYFATMSLAAMDWIASREADWYSSTFGLATITGQGATGVAFLIVALFPVSAVPPMRGLATADAVHDLGNLLLTVVLLWTYVTFAQYLVIWIGNSQEDITWYVHRTSGPWWYVGVGIIALHFATPFAFLLFQKTKRRLGALAAVAGAVLVMRVVDLVWMVDPSSAGPEPRGVSWVDFLAPPFVIGLWVARWAWLLARAPLIPLGYRVPARDLRGAGSGTGALGEGAA